MATGGRAGQFAGCRVATVAIVDDSRRLPLAPRWRRVALTVAGALAVATATAFVMQTGEAATTITEAKKLDSAPPTRTVVATPGPRTSSPPAEAVTVTMSPQSRVAAETLVSLAPTASPPAVQPMRDPREIVYTVAGNLRPEDPVTIVYADETGALRTAENVSLPWTMTVVPSPDAPVNYVTATSFGSQLNCWITDAVGATVASQVENTITTTCNR